MKQSVILIDFRRDVGGESSLGPDEYRGGLFAGMAGQSHHTNPFQPLYEEGQDWLFGWLDGARALRRANKEQEFSA